MSRRFSRSVAASNSRSVGETLLGRPRISADTLAQPSEVDADALVVVMVERVELEKKAFDVA
jgi:hypothetical protein